jgi:WD40-like Beta Propeller Repeat
MNEIKELFDVVTKQTEPDQEAWKEQEDRQRRTARNRRIGAFVGAAAVVVAGVIAIATLRGGDEGSPVVGPPSDSPSAPMVTTHYYVNIATGQRSPVAAELVGARLAEVSPNGDAIAYSTCCGYDSLYVTDLDGSSEVATITPETLDGYMGTWIDDETILFQGRHAGTSKLGDLYVANISTGKLNMVTDLPNDRSGAWIVRADLSPDGRTVLYHLPRGKRYNEEWDLWTAPIAGGQATLLRKDAGFAAYAPDGSIVFLDHPFDFVSKQIWMMDGNGSNARPLVKGGTFSWPSVSPDGTMVAYGNEGKAEVVDIASGDVTPLDVVSEAPAWDGNDTLIVDARIPLTP